MVKQRSSKAYQGSEEGSVVADEKKPSSAAKKSGDEIDEIFASKKRVKGAQVKANKRNGDALSPGPKKMKKNKKERGDNNDRASERARKRTGDGLVVYTEDELGINKSDAGGTPLCPFDCSCCF